MSLNLEAIDQLSKAPLLSDPDGQAVAAHFLGQAAPLLTPTPESIVDKLLARVEPLGPTHRTTLLENLAQLTPVEAALRLEPVAAKIGVAQKVIEQEMKRLRKTPASTSTADAPSGVFLADTVPAAGPVDGVTLFHAILNRIRRHIVLSDAAAVAVALWVFQAHCAEAFGITPRLAVQSPTKGCGKTNLLEIVKEQVPRALPVSNVTAAALFRTIEAHTPTLLIDEADSFMRENEELRGIVNSGYRRKTAQVVRTVGDTHEPKTFGTYAPMVIACIGELPETIQDRSIVIPLKRKTPEETVEDIRWESRKGKDLEADLQLRNRELARWAVDHLDAVRDTEPMIPTGLFNRKADNWFPLLAIAEVIGGPAVEQARAAALTLSAVEPSNQGKEIELLRDIQEILTHRDGDWPVQEVCDRLVALEERPWATWKKGRPLDPSYLARYLRPFEITSRNIRHEGRVLKGYDRTQLEDAFRRYLTASHPENPLSSRYTATMSHQSGESPLLAPATTGVCSGMKKRLNPAPRVECSGVAGENRKTTLWGENVDELEVFDDA